MFDFMKKMRFEPGRGTMGRKFRYFEMCPAGEQRGGSFKLILAVAYRGGSFDISKCARPVSNGVEVSN
jgi:hypothetical protein